MDEKGFLVSMLTKLRRVFSRAVFKSGRVKNTIQDGNREWITVLATICADGTTLSPGLIYQAVSGDIQDSWLQDYDPNEHPCFFASSPTGWTNNDLAYSWLDTIFNRETKAKTRNGRDCRLLIVVRHGSHVNIRFLEYCDKHRILVAVYTSHSTHRLQPLDVSLFLPLATYDSQRHINGGTSLFGFLTNFSSSGASFFTNSIYFLICLD
jgi:DDE superfamily endonuclease